MVEAKADALEQSFEAFEEDQEDGVAALKEELETLKAKIAAQRRVRCPLLRQVKFPVPAG